MAECGFRDGRHGIRWRNLYSGLHVEPEFIVAGYILEAARRTANRESGVNSKPGDYRMRHIIKQERRAHSGLP